MAVIRVEKTKNYTAMSNYHLRDKNLSLKAKGLLSVCLSLTDDWEYSVNGLAAISKEGRTAILNTLKELEDAGYVRREQPHRPDGTMGKVEYTIFEMPMDRNPVPQSGTPAADKPIAGNLTSEKPQSGNPTADEPTADEPTAGNPTSDKPQSENPPQLNTKQSSTERLSTELSKEAAAPPAPPAQKRRYGTFRNVLLTDSEFAAFQRAWPDWQRKIDHLSGYISTTRRDYPDHYRTLVKWAKEDAAKTPAAGPRDPPRENTSEQMQDILWIQGFMDAHGKEFGIRDAPDSAQGEEVMNHGQGRDPTDPAGPASPVPKPPVPGGG